MLTDLKLRTLKYIFHNLVSLRLQMAPLSEGERGEYARDRCACGESGLDRGPRRGRLLCGVPGAQDAPGIRARPFPRLSDRAAGEPDRALQLAAASPHGF